MVFLWVFCFYGLGAENLDVALGGRIDAYRAALTDPDDAALIEAVSRNMTLNEGADSAAIAAEIRVIARTLDQTSAADLIAGRFVR